MTDQSNATAMDVSGAVAPETPQPTLSVPRGSGMLVAFDFDGTLTTRDSFTDFLKWRSGWFGYGFGLVRLLPAALGFLVHRNHGRLKSAAINVFLKGMPVEKLEADARRFAELTARDLFRPDAVAALRRWRAQGARIVIVTASPEFLVGPFARGLGADLLIGSLLTSTTDGRVGSGLSGANCRGEEKVRRLKELFGGDVRLVAAYGDSSGDREMLAIADEKGYRLFTAKP